MDGAQKLDDLFDQTEKLLAKLADQHGPGLRVEAVEVFTGIAGKAFVSAAVGQQNIFNPGKILPAV